MITRRVENNNIKLESRQFCHDLSDVVRQRVVNNLSVWKGEYFVNIRDIGVDYINKVLGKQRSSRIPYAEILRNVSGIDGVSSVINLDSIIEGDNIVIKIAILVDDDTIIKEEIII